MLVQCPPKLSQIWMMLNQTVQSLHAWITSLLCASSWTSSANRRKRPSNSRSKMQDDVRRGITLNCHSLHLNARLKTDQKWGPLQRWWANQHGKLQMVQCLCLKKRVWTMTKWTQEGRWWTNESKITRKPKRQSKEKWRKKLQWIRLHHHDQIKTQIMSSSWLYQIRCRIWAWLRKSQVKPYNLQWVRRKLAWACLRNNHRWS